MGRGRRRTRGARVQLGPATQLSVQPYLRRVAGEGRERRVAGGFDVFINPDRPGLGSNYAIPQDGIEPTAADIARMVAAFGAAHRRPRLEYVPATAPAAEAALLAAGFEVELRTTVMTCTAATVAVAAPPDGVVLDALGAGATLDEVNALQAVQARAFGDEPEPYTARPRWLGDYLAVLARDGDAAAGAGMSLALLDGMTELVGIAVAEPFRRRGIGTAITADLARRAFERGAGSAFLTPGDDGATRVYARAGFTATDEMLHLRGPTPAAGRR